MEIQELQNSNEYIDILGMTPDKADNQIKSFGGSEELEFDILKNKEVQTDPDPDKKSDDPIEPEKKEEVDILDNNTKPGRKPKYDFSDIEGYFKDRIEKGKFVAVEEETPEGVVPFIPKTPEEFDEIIELQVEHKLSKEKENLEKKWYESKNPAWQMVAQYAEMVNHPSELLPIIQGVSNIDSLESLDPQDLAHAETIVRFRLEQRGEDKDIIDETIDSLKNTNKLATTAEKYKPVIMQEQQLQIKKAYEERVKQEQEYYSLISSIRQEVIETIEQPFLGKHKLKNEEKAKVFDLIGQPSAETKGYKIYDAIDNLFEKKEYDKLRKIALLLTDEDSFFKYSGVIQADRVAEGLQRKLRTVTDKASSSLSKDQEYREQQSFIPKYKPFNSK
jgi:hypothetical protein